MSITSKTIFLVGKVSSGKSSLLNSLVGNFVSNVSNTSLQRETFNPLHYSFTPKGSIKNIKSISESLNDQHKKNEKMRIINDKNMDIIKIPDLPISNWNINSDIIDFPGLDDSDNSTGHFFELVAKHIQLADIILYVTDASTACTNSSEIDIINKLISLIKSRELDHHQYIKFIVAVNKFDSPDDKDLIEISNRIVSKIDISINDIYNISSHKLLIDLSIHEKKNLYVPQFMKKEIEKIFQSSNVIVTKNLKNTLKTQDLIKYTDIKYLTNLLSDSSSSDDSFEETDKTNKKIFNIITSDKIKGDWNGLLYRIQIFREELYTSRQKMMDRKYGKLMEEYMENYKYTITTEELINYNLSTYTSERDNSIQSCLKIREMILFDKFINYYEISKQYGHLPNILTEIKNMLVTNDLSNKRFYFLELLIQQCNKDNTLESYLLNELIDLIMNNLLLLSIETKIVICCLLVSRPIKKMHKLYFDIFRHQESFNYKQLTLYTKKNNYNTISDWVPIITINIDNSEKHLIIRHRLAFVGYICDVTKNTLLRKMLKICILPREILFPLYLEKQITNTDFKTTVDYNKFVYWVTTSNNNAFLLNKIFNTELIIGANNYINALQFFIK